MSENQKAAEPAIMTNKKAQTNAPLSELEDDLEELGADLFGARNALSDGLDKGDLPVISKGVHDAIKDVPSLINTGKKIDDAVHNLAEEALDNPDVVIDNIAKSGLADAVWGLLSCLSWTGLSNLFTSIAAILFPAAPEAASATPEVKPDTPKVEPKEEAKVESAKVEAVPAVPEVESVKSEVKPDTPKVEPKEETKVEPAKVEAVPAVPEVESAMPEVMAAVDDPKPLVEPAMPVESM